MKDRRTRKPYCDHDPDFFEKHVELHRRDFLHRIAIGSAASAALGAGAWWLNRQPPLESGLGRSSTPESVLPDWSRDGTKGRMAIARGSDRYATLVRAVESLGGMRSFVKPGERVLLKVNAAFASPASVGATTHPALVAALTNLCIKAGATVSVLDNPISDPKSTFSLSGIRAAAEESGARLLLPTPGFFARFTLERARRIRDWPIMMKPLLEFDRVIGVTPVKDHLISGASMTMKNWYGLLGGRRNRLHQDIHQVVAELGRMVRPSLVVLDATTPMVRNGPTGGSPSDLRSADTMIVSTDPVAADAFGCSFLGLQPSDLRYLGLAADAGVGVVDWRSLDPIET